LKTKPVEIITLPTRIAMIRTIMLGLNLIYQKI
jgi:hypothetical protein